MFTYVYMLGVDYGRYQVYDEARLRRYVEIDKSGQITWIKPLVTDPRWYVSLPKPDPRGQYKVRQHD